MKTKPGLFQVLITEKRLNELRMLMDWQIRELGFVPSSINTACSEADADNQEVLEMDLDVPASTQSTW